MQVGEGADESTPQRLPNGCERRDIGDSVEEHKEPEKAVFLQLQQNYADSFYDHGGSKAMEVTASRQAAPCSVLYRNCDRAPIPSAALDPLCGLRSSDRCRLLAPFTFAALCVGRICGRCPWLFD